jgi:outer membrane protein TolC
MRDLKRLLHVSCLLFLVSNTSYAQRSLDYFLKEAENRSPALKEQRNSRKMAELGGRLNRAENSAFHVSLSSNYLFTPYFNNNGDFVTTQPGPEAIGYDINLFDGGLYSAQLNVERNLFNGRLMDALDTQSRIQGDNYDYAFTLERHNLEKEVTDQYLSALRASRMTRLTQELVTDLEEQLKLTEELMEQGFVKAQDYLLLQIEVKSRTVGLRDVKQQYQSELLQLYALCGIEDTTVVEIEPVTLSPAPPVTASNFMQKFALDSLAAASEQSVFDAKYRPQFHAFFNTGLNAVELQDIERRFGMAAGVDLSLPIFDGGQRDLTRQQSLVAQRTIGEYRRFSARNIDLQRRDLRSRIEFLRGGIESLNEQIADYRRLLDITVKQLQQGNMSMIDYLALVRGFTELRKTAIETEIDYQLAVNNYNYWNW